MSYSPNQAMRLIKELSDACNEELGLMIEKDNSAKTFNKNSYNRLSGKRAAYIKCLEIMAETENKVW